MSRAIPGILFSWYDEYKNAKEVIRYAEELNPSNEFLNKCRELVNKVGYDCSLVEFPESKKWGKVALYLQEQIQGLRQEISQLKSIAEG